MPTNRAIKADRKDWNIRGLPVIVHVDGRRRSYVAQVPRHASDERLALNDDGTISALCVRVVDGRRARISGRAELIGDEWHFTPKLPA